jgi:predicted DNA-binding transcriptional regulator YafY
MDLDTIKCKLERIDQLIRLESTGNPKQLVERLNVSERTVYRMINTLKDIGCPVYYNRYRSSYCYRFKGKIIIDFSMY